MALRFTATSSARPPAADLLHALHRHYDAAAGRALSGGPSAEPSDFAPPSGAFLVGYEDDRAIACGGLKTVAPGVAEVKRMYVVPEARRRGVGRALLEALEAQARVRGLTTVRLDCERHNWPFYRAAGYVEIADYNDNPFAHHWAEKALDARITLITPDLATLDAAIDDPRALAGMVGGAVAEGWAVFPQAIPRVRDALVADPGSVRWGTRLFRLDRPPTLVGWGGFKGPPRDGAVEIGYAIAPGWEGRGLATAAARELVRDAFEAPEVTAILAHTRPERGGSSRVLEKAGFAFEGAVPDEQIGTAWRFRLERPAP